MALLLLQAGGFLQSFARNVQNDNLKNMSKFIQFNVSFAPYLIRCAGPSGSLTVRFYRESNHLSHSCDKPALERLKCQVVFITSTAGLRLNLSLVYVTTSPLPCCKTWNCLVYANGHCLAHQFSNFVCITLHLLVNKAMVHIILPSMHIPLDFSGEYTPLVCNQDEIHRDFHLCLQEHCFTIQSVLFIFI